MHAGRIVGVLGKVDGLVRIEVVYEAVHVLGRPNRPNYIANFAVNSSGTNSVVNFAENYFEQFDVMACEDDHHMLRVSTPCVFRK
jgi:hypothetical protein